MVDFVVPFADLGDAKPQVNSTSACQVRKRGEVETIFFHQAVVSTMCQPQYESNVADADILISAKVIKVTTTHPTASTFCSPGQVQAGGCGQRDAVSRRGSEETMHGHQHSGEGPQQQRRLLNSSSVAIFLQTKLCRLSRQRLSLQPMRREKGETRN